MIYIAMQTLSQKYVKVLSKIVNVHYVHKRFYKTSKAMPKLNILLLFLLILCYFSIIE